MKNQIKPAMLSKNATQDEIKELSIENIFSEDHNWVNSLASDKKIILMVTGDMLLARSVNFKTVTKKNFNWPFEKTYDALKSADITFVNLETTLIENCQLTNEGMKFCGDPHNIEGLLTAGVDIVNVANNHSGNYGSEGLHSTVNFLNKAGLGVTGTAGAVYKEIRGKRFAFLGYSEFDYPEEISGAFQEKITSETRNAKLNADFVIVQFHWGTEYTTIINTKQRELAHLAIDSGADLVVGNHPHWIQPAELYKGKLISYSHGNFVCDQEWSKKTKEGVVGKYTFYNGKLIDAQYLPVQIENYGQPYFLDTNKSKKILDEIKMESVN